VLDPAAPLRLDHVPAHGAVLLAIRRVATSPTLVGSTFHFSQGAEIRRWELDGHSLRFNIELGRSAEGEVRLWLPAPPREASIETRPAAIVDLGAGIYSLQLAVNNAAEVRVDVS
jgi:hypothetical protein